MVLLKQIDLRLNCTKKAYFVAFVLFKIGGMSLYSKCPICKAKTVRDQFAVRCRRCGWMVTLELDNLTKKLFFG